MNSNSEKIMPLPLWIYIIGIVCFGYLFISVLQFKAEDSHNLLLSGMYMINFGVHEMSHIVLGFLPPIPTAAAGSVGEISFTLLLLFATVRSKAYFAAVFVAQWVMLAFMSAGRYMADARTQLLPLAGPGETVQHDWYFIFSQLGWLESDTLIGGIVKAIGIIIGLGGLAFGVFLIIRKITTPPVKDETPLRTTF